MTLVAEGHKRVRLRGEVEVEEQLRLASLRAAATPHPLAPKGGLWPTRRRKAAAGNAYVADLDAIRAASRQKAVDRLVKDILAVDLPVLRDVAGALDPDLALKYLAGTRRAAALRSRLSALSAPHRWLRTSLGAAWPKGPQDVIMYLEVRAAEPCGRVMPREAISALAPVEEVGQAPSHERLPFHPLAVGGTDMLTSPLARATPREVREANEFSVRLSVQFEDFVCDTNAEFYIRSYAVLKCLNLRSSPHFDDPSWADPRGDIPSDTVPEAAQECARVGGPGEEWEILRSHVARGAYLWQWNCLPSWFVPVKEALDRLPFFLHTALEDPTRTRRASTLLAWCSRGLPQQYKL